MNYIVKFGNMTVTAPDLKTATTVAVALAFRFQRVEVWIGNHLVWEYEN